MPNAGGKPRAVLTVALTLTGRKVVGTAGTGEKVDVRPIPSEVVVGMSALETEVETKIETEIEIGAGTAIGDAESDALTASRTTAGGLTLVRAPRRGPKTGTSTRTAAVTTERARPGPPGGARTRGSGPRKPSRQAWALGKFHRLTSRGPRVRAACRLASGFCNCRRWQ